MEPIFPHIDPARLTSEFQRVLANMRAAIDTNRTAVGQSRKAIEDTRTFLLAHRDWKI
jgi:hypothetical protein